MIHQMGRCVLDLGIPADHAEHVQKCTIEQLCPGKGMKGEKERVGEGSNQSMPSQKIGQSPLTIYGTAGWPVVPQGCAAWVSL